MGVESILEPMRKLAQAAPPADCIMLPFNSNLQSKKKSHKKRKTDESEKVLVKSSGEEIPPAGDQLGSPRRKKSHHKMHKVSKFRSEGEELEGASGEPDQALLVSMGTGQQDLVALVDDQCPEEKQMRKKKKKKKVSESRPEGGELEGSFGEADCSLLAPVNSGEENKQKRNKKKKKVSESRLESGELEEVLFTAVLSLPASMNSGEEMVPADDQNAEKEKKKKKKKTVSEGGELECVFASGDVSPPATMGCLDQEASTGDPMALPAPTKSLERKRKRSQKKQEQKAKTAKHDFPGADQSLFDTDDSSEQRSFAAACSSAIGAIIRPSDSELETHRASSRKTKPSQSAEEADKRRTENPSSCVAEFACVPFVPTRRKQSPRKCVAPVQEPNRADISSDDSGDSDNMEDPQSIDVSPKTHDNVSTRRTGFGLARPIRRSSKKPRHRCPVPRCIGNVVNLRRHLEHCHIDLPAEDITRLLEEEKEHRQRNKTRKPRVVEESQETAVDPTEKPKRIRVDPLKRCSKCNVLVKRLDVHLRKTHGLHKDSTEYRQISSSSQRLEPAPLATGPLTLQRLMKDFERNLKDIAERTIDGMKSQDQFRFSTIGRALKNNQ